jgi:hypothetical protein
MRRRAPPVRWRQYWCRAGSAHNSVEALSWSHHHEIAHLDDAADLNLAGAG